MWNWELLWNENLWTKIIKKSFWLYFFMIFTAPIGYIIKVIVSNKLSVEDIGIFYSILWFIWLISVYNDLWLTEALQYFLPKYRIEKKYNNYKTIIYLTFFVQLISWILVWWLLYFWADWLAVHHFNSPDAVNIVKIFSIYFLLINFLQAFYNFYTSFQDTFSSSLTDSIRLFSILIFTIFFWLNNTLTTELFSIWWIIWLVIAIITSTIIFLKKYSHTLKLGRFEPSKELISKQLKYAFWVFLAANVGTLFGNINQQIVINFYWAESAWYYANYLSLVTIFGVIIWPVLSLLFPITTELISKNEKEKFGVLQNIMYKYFSIFAFSISWLFLVFWTEISTVLFWVKFAYSGTLMVYSAPFLFFTTLFGINYGIMAWLGKVKERVRILLYWLIWLIVIDIIAIIVAKSWIDLWITLIILSNIVWRILLWFFSFKTIHAYQKIIFNRKFLIWNLFTIILISTIFYIFKDNFLFLDNNHRYSNILYLFIAWVIFYWILAIVNYKSIKILVSEVKGILWKK